MAVRVSIIMGIYNCEATLPEAIESILSQTFTEWKLIMCDDGSKDGTKKIAETYQKQYPDRIVLLGNSNNMGLNYTLNRCLEYADSEYIARMDGDDISLPTRLEKEVRFLDNNPQYAIVSCPMIYFDEGGDFMRGVGNGEPKVSSFCKGTPFCHAPCMVRSEAYRTVHGYTLSDKRLRVEDWDLWVRMYTAGYRGYNLEEPLYKMRDDRNAFHRRKLRYRLNEARVSVAAVRSFKLSPINYLWCARPIIVGLLPRSIYRFLHTIKRRKG